MEHNIKDTLKQFQSYYSLISNDAPLDLTLNLNLFQSYYSLISNLSEFTLSNLEQFQSYYSLISN